MVGNIKKIIKRCFTEDDISPWLYFIQRIITWEQIFVFLARKVFLCQIRGLVPWLLLGRRPSAWCAVGQWWSVGSQDRKWFQETIEVRWPIRENVTLALLPTPHLHLPEQDLYEKLGQCHILSSSVIEYSYSLRPRYWIIVAVGPRQRVLIMTGNLYQTRPAAVDTTTTFQAYRRK